MGPDPRREWGAHELARVIDHTLLAAQATTADVERLCDEAREHLFATVCVSGVHVRRCAQRLTGSPVGVCAVVGFPLGASHPLVKAHEARQALADGARELDVVLQIGALRAGEHAFVARDIECVIAEARPARARVKVILETGLLTRDEIAAACRLAEAAGADFVKTGTGFGPRGATTEDVELLRASASPRVGVKAAGGVRTARFARELLAAGATRLGTSASLAIVSQAAQG
jgi:deoxyribose-phosphate aldolase